MPTDDNDSNLLSEGTAKGIVIALALVCGVVAWRWKHPPMTFAMDGADARWDAAVEHNRETHRPAIVLFTADWCGACQALHSQTLSRPEIEEEIHGHYTMLTIDLTQPSEADTDRYRKFGLNGIPTLIRFDADGNETGRAHYLSPRQMLGWLRDGE